MGARQRAQHRAKGYKKGSEKGSPYSQKKSSSGLQVTNLEPFNRSKALQGWNQFAKSESTSGYGTPHNGFSMMQEARNTDRHASGWGSVRLRDNAVAFVSAGHLTREEPQEQSSSSSEDDEEEDSPDEEPSETFHTQDQQDQQSAMVISEATESIHITEPDIPTPKPIQKEYDSSSEDEELVFRGRNAVAQSLKIPPNAATSRPVSRSPNPEAAIFVPSPQSQPKNLAQSLPQSTPAVHKISTPAISVPKSSQIPAIPQYSTSLDVASSSRPQRHVNSRYRKGWRSRKQAEQDEDDEVLEDYIANMAKGDENDETDEAGGNKPQRRNETFRFYDGAAESHIKVQTKTRDGRTPRLPKQAPDWSSDDLADFDDLSTTDDEANEVEQVLRYRDRPTGAQYLVTLIGQTTGDAKWMLHSKLNSESALNEIQAYHEIENMEVEVDSDSEDSDELSTSGQEAVDDLIGDIESEADENTKIFEHTERMTDEQIAQMLAKQEELGMDADEIMLFNGQGMEDSEDNFADGNGFIPFSISKHTSNRGRNKRNKRQRDSFPSAEAFADALEQDPYGGFDVMDFERPSLRPKRRGKNSYPFDLDLEDDDLEQQLVSTWMKDREKKVARKREKMEFRAAELLEAGERSDPAVIKAEIRRFMVEETETLRLAPMESHLRASVHRLAKSLNLHSRSEGKDGQGVGRMPVLTKTLKTPYYTYETIGQIDALMNLRKFFPKHGGGSYRGPKATKTPGKKGRSGGGFAAASYATGEVVGGSAPELAEDNKGRLLMEKMGWLKGTGIGKEGNVGSLEHVKHVVKNNKAGLG